MRTESLSAEAVLAAYDVVSRLYPYVPPLSLWRSWEYAAYQRFSLPEPVLDVGCGDGQFFRLVWPHVREAVGVDIDPRVAEAARASGVYREVHVGPAHALPFPDESFAAAFANCSLEHMDHLPEVLRSVARCLRPGAPFLLSVVTDKLVEWATLPLLVETVGEPQRARSLQAEYEAFHHLVNPLPPEGWVRALEAAGFTVEVYVPIIPEMTSRLFLFLDHLWHVRWDSAEVGDYLYAYFERLPEFPQAFRHILLAFLRLERDFSVGSGAVFWARRSSIEASEAARLEVIQRQAALIQELEADRAALQDRLGQAEVLLQEVLALRNSRIYRALRKVGRWDWVERLLQGIETLLATGRSAGGAGSQGGGGDDEP